MIISLTFSNFDSDKNKDKETGVKVPNQNLYGKLKKKKKQIHHHIWVQENIILTEFIRSFL
jgi:hypothetical protein